MSARIHFDIYTQFAKDDMILDLVSPSVWIALAGALFTLGYLIINQVTLRIVMLLGSLCYIAYYATAAEDPLWGAIYGSILMIVANLIGLFALLWRNAMWSLPKAHKDIFPLFAPMRPGDFRTLMRLGQRYTADQSGEVTREGAKLDKLYFLISGKVKVEKMGSSFHMEGPLFMGEVAYLLQSGSAATTYVLEGSEIVSWERADLEKAINRRPRIKLALDAMISNDLARKVSYAVAPAHFP